jgi:hypothetical protein
MGEGKRLSDHLLSVSANCETQFGSCYWHVWAGRDLQIPQRHTLLHSTLVDSSNGASSPLKADCRTPRFSRFAGAATSLCVNCVRPVTNSSVRERRQFWGTDLISVRPSHSSCEHDSSHLEQSLQYPESLLELIGASVGQQALQLAQQNIVINFLSFVIEECGWQDLKG